LTLPFSGAQPISFVLSGDELVKLTGPTKSSPAGFTFSDLTQRLLPTLVLDAYPDKAISFRRAVQLLDTIVATPQFLEK